MSQVEADRTLAILGGRRVLPSLSIRPGKRAVTKKWARVEWTAALRSGLPPVTLENTANHLGLSVSDLSARIGLAPSTVHRKLRQGSRLSSEEGERALRVARAAARAEALLGRGNGPKWLLRPCRGLGGSIPLTLLDTAIGFDQVLDELGRIEYGVIS